MKLDHRSLYYANAQKNEFLVPKLLKKILPEYRLPLIDGLMKFAFIDTSDYIIPSYVPHDNLRIYSGISEIYDKLKDVYYPNAINSEYRYLRDTIAQHSSGLSKDKSTSEQSAWFMCGKEQAGQLCVKTMESGYTEHYHIGSLVLIEDYTDQPSKLTIGQVMKINRQPNDKYVQFSIKHLGLNAHPVTMTGINNVLNEPCKGKLVLGAIMVKLSAEINTLIIPFSRSYWCDSEVVIFKDKQKIHTTFTKVENMSQDFYQFRLKADTLGIT